MADEVTTEGAGGGVAVAEPGLDAAAAGAAGGADGQAGDAEGGGVAAPDVWDLIPDEAIDDNGDVDLSKVGKGAKAMPEGAEGDGKAHPAPASPPSADEAAAKEKAEAEAAAKAKAAADAKARAAEPPPAPTPADLAGRVKQIADILTTAGKVKLADGTEFDFAQFHEEFPEVGQYQTAALAVLIDKLGLRPGDNAGAAQKAAEQVAALQAEVGRMQWERSLTDLRADAPKVIRSPEFKAWAVKFYETATPGQRAVFDSNDPKDSLRIIDEFEQATGVAAKREAARRQASKASLHSVGQPAGRGPAPTAGRSVDEIWDRIKEDELD